MLPLVVGFLILLVSFVLQTALVPYFKIAGIQPDLILIVVVVYAFIEDPISGSAVGFVGGLLEDLASMQVVGVNALTKTIIGYFSGMFEKTILLENWLFVPLAVFIATVVGEAIYLGLLFLVGVQTAFSLAMTSVIIPTAIYNSLISPFVYLALLRLLEKVPTTRPSTPGAKGTMVKRSKIPEYKKDVSRL